MLAFVYNKSLTRHVFLALAQKHGLVSFAHAGVLIKLLCVEYITNLPRSSLSRFTPSGSPLPGRSVNALSA